MGTVWPSGILISLRTPAEGEGISASTLSVEISKSGSSRSTLSPGFLSHLVMVPSKMLSPIWGMTTSTAMTFSPCAAGRPRDLGELENPGSSLPNPRNLTSLQRKRSDGNSVTGSRVPGFQLKRKFSGRHEKGARWPCGLRTGKDAARVQCDKPPARRRPGRFVRERNPRHSDNRRRPDGSPERSERTRLPPPGGAAGAESGRGQTRRREGRDYSVVPGKTSARLRRGRQCFDRQNRQNPRPATRLSVRRNARTREQLPHPSLWRSVPHRG